MAKSSRSTPKPRKRKPSFDRPQAPSAPVDTTWVYRSDPAAAPPSGSVIASASTPAIEMSRADQPSRGSASVPANVQSLPQSVLHGTLYWVGFSLTIGEAVPNLGIDAMRRVAGFVPGAGTLIGILAMPVQANAAAIAVGRRFLRAITGETTSAGH